MRGSEKIYTVLSSCCEPSLALEWGVLMTFIPANILRVIQCHTVRILKNSTNIYSWDPSLVTWLATINQVSILPTYPGTLLYLTYPPNSYLDQWRLRGRPEKGLHKMAALERREALRRSERKSWRMTQILTSKLASTMDSNVWRASC